MHEWGETGVDWRGINDAAEFIGEYCRKWGRIGTSSKEKYGTVRVYTDIGYISLHSLVYPGRVHNNFPSWLWNLDIDYIGPALNKIFGRLFIRWQERVYYKAYKKAIYKWPHLRAEILVCADHLDLLSDGSLVFTVGNKIEILGWDGEVIAMWITNSNEDLEC